MDPFYKSLKGSFTLQGSTGNVTFDFMGSKVPDDLSKVPAYVAELIQKAVIGATPGEEENLRKIISEKNAKIDQLVEELKMAKAPKRASRSLSG